MNSSYLSHINSRGSHTTPVLLSGKIYDLITPVLPPVCGNRGWNWLGSPTPFAGVLSTMTARACLRVVRLADWPLLRLTPLVSSLAAQLACQLV